MFITAPSAARSSGLPPAIKVSGQELRLNGQGDRSKYLIDVYAVGLYLPQPSQDAQAIIDADQLMLIRIEVTSKLITQERLIDALMEGFEKSTDGDLKSIEDQTQQLRQYIADPIAIGDVFDLIYAPGQGVFVYKNSKKRGLVTGMPFKQALFGIWLGERPVDAKLRQKLLGLE